MRAPALALVVLAAACAPPAAQRGGEGAAAAGAGGAEAPFTDVTAAAGIRFVHRTGASGRKYLPETMGSGCGFIDYDGDGDPDLYFANGAPLPGDDTPVRPGALYRNRGDGSFEDVTASAGLGEPFYGMGVAVGDVDNDGDADLFVSALGPDRTRRAGHARLSRGRAFVFG